MATNGQLIIGSKFTPRSLQDRIAAYQDYFTNAKAALKEREDYIIKSQALRNYLDPMADRNFIQKIDDYDKQLDEIASDMAIGGYTNSVYNKAQQAKKIYSGDLLNIERLYNIREKERERFNKMRENVKGTFMYAMDPYSTSLDEMYAKGNDLNIGYMKDSNDFFLRGQEIGKGFNNTAAYARSTITEADLNGITGILTKKVQSRGRGEKDFKDLLGEEDLSKLSPAARNLYKDLADAAQKEIESGAPDKYKEDIIKELKRGVASVLNLQLDETVHFDRDHSGGGSSGGGMGLIQPLPVSSKWYAMNKPGYNTVNEQYDRDELFPPESGRNAKVVIDPETGIMSFNGVYNVRALNDDLLAYNKSIEDAKNELKKIGALKDTEVESRAALRRYLAKKYGPNRAHSGSAGMEHQFRAKISTAFLKPSSEDTLLGGLNKQVGEAYQLMLNDKRRVVNTAVVIGEGSKQNKDVANLKSILRATFQNHINLQDWSIQNGFDPDSLENVEAFAAALGEENSELFTEVVYHNGTQYGIFKVVDKDNNVHEVLMNPTDTRWEEGLSFSEGLHSMMTVFDSNEGFKTKLGTFVGQAQTSANTFTSKTGIKGVIDKFAEVASEYYDSQAIDSTGQPTDFSKTVTSQYGSKEQFIESLKQNIQNNLSTVGIRSDKQNTTLTSFLMKALNSNDETKKYVITGGAGNNQFMMLNIAVGDTDGNNAQETNIYKIGLQLSSDASTDNMTVHTNTMNDYYGLASKGNYTSFEIVGQNSMQTNYDAVSGDYLNKLILKLVASMLRRSEPTTQNESVDEYLNSNQI